MAASTASSTTPAEHDVLCIGNAIVDILATVEDSFLDRHDSTKSAMNLVDEAKSASIYDDLPPAQEVSGGSAGNTAVGIASLGGKAAYIGKVRDDQLGGIFRHDIKAAGVSFETAPADSGEATATSIILITPDAQRTMNTYLGACANLTPADILEETVASAKVTYVEGYLWDRPNAKEAVTKAMDLARAADRQVSLTLSDSFCVDRFRDEFRTLAREKVDILFANEDEILSFYETDDFEEAAALVAKDVAVAAITRSEKGSVVVAGDDRFEAPAYPTDVVDTTGAGDLYAAGFLFGYTNGMPFETCARLGSLAASEIIDHVGARPKRDLVALATEHGLLG